LEDGKNRGKTVEKKPLFDGFYSELGIQAQPVPFPVGFYSNPCRKKALEGCAMALGIVKTILPLILDLVV
jgi:hypothetical protein